MGPSGEKGNEGASETADVDDDDSLKGETANLRLLQRAHTHVLYARRELRPPTLARGYAPQRKNGPLRVKERPPQGPTTYILHENRNTFYVDQRTGQIDNLGN